MPSLSALTISSLKLLQCAQNTAARLSSKIKIQNNISAFLHWLPVLDFILEWIVLNLRLAELYVKPQILLMDPVSKVKLKGGRTFTARAPNIWNILINLCMFIAGLFLNRF